MPNYAVQIKATVWKTIFVEGALNEDEAKQFAREQFTAAPNVDDEKYEETIVSIEEVK